MLSLKPDIIGCHNSIIGGGGSRIDFPKENALKFTLEKGWVCIRPSGTEPKIKLYIAVTGSTDEQAQTMLTALKDDATKMLKA